MCIGFIKLLITKNDYKYFLFVKGVFELSSKNNVVLSFSENENIITEVTNLMKNENQSYVEFVDAKGSVKEFTVLSSGQGGALNSMSFNDPFSVNAIHGKIEKIKGQFMPIVYVSLTRNGVGSLSGQLVKAKAVEGLEITARKVNMSKIIVG